MSQLLHWPSQYYFYPFGNTSAVSLTTDLPIEESAQILLLGCGDPRNVLFTIFNEPKTSTRRLDFTCCDHDPAILARNILLLTMAIDRHPIDVIWNIFFHFRLDLSSKAILISQCEKLVGLSDTLGQWKLSIYGPHLPMCTAYTLSEIRRHWILYKEMDSVPETRLNSIKTAITKLATENQKRALVGTALRSNGPLIFDPAAISVPIHSYPNYWKTGTSFFDKGRQQKATELNPTFAYSLGGEGASFHYGCDPLIPFHLAPIFGNTQSESSISQVFDGAMAQFDAWCSSYCAKVASSSSLAIRFFVGDAIAVANALSRQPSRSLKTSIPVAPWKSTLIELDEEYGTGEASATFNVIHTSNLVDDIGLFNLILAAAPLLSHSPYATLYSESILHTGSNATKAFSKSMKADISIMSLFLDLVPVDYQCGFTSRSNTHEIAFYRFIIKNHKTPEVEQYHQVTTWKRLTSGDAITAAHQDRLLTPAFDARELGTLIYDIYNDLFSQETITAFMEANSKNVPRAIAASNMAQETRESFVLLLKRVKDRLGPSENLWNETMSRFRILQSQDVATMDGLYFQYLSAQLLLHDVFRSPLFNDKASKVGRLTNWATIPDLVRIILVVPRSALAILEGSNPQQVGTPPLQGDIFTANSHAIFSTLSTAFGKVIPTGTAANPSVLFEEDTAGWRGKSSLIVSFVAPAWLLTDKDPPQDVMIGFGVRNTPAAVHMIKSKLGIDLRIFSAKAVDETQVHVLPGHPLPNRSTAVLPHLSSPKHNFISPPLLAQIGNFHDGKVQVNLDEQCELLDEFNAHIAITDNNAIREFCAEGSKVTPVVRQLSPCVLRLSVGDRHQDVLFPLPVQGDGSRLRLARKSRYIEILVKPSRSLLPGGFALNPYPVVSTNGSANPWSIHHVTLSKSPSLDLPNPKRSRWLVPHLGLQFSTRESDLKSKKKSDSLTLIKDSINSIFRYATGTQTDTLGPIRTLFCLRDRKTRDTDTLFFINDIRFDLGSHTVVLDAYVLNLTLGMIERLGLTEPFGKLVTEGDMCHITVYEGEMQSWKQLLPALVERCRDSWSHTPNCEYKTQKQIPLSVEEDMDPLCRCGQGKNTQGMKKNELWGPFAPHVTQFALSPLFGVSYLETVGRSPDAHKCSKCRGRGKPKIMMCAGCKRARYCSAQCQKADWASHKVRCKS